MTVKKLLVLLIYLGLFSVALIFVKQSVQEYLEETTGYTVTHEPLSLNDLPATTLCHVWTLADWKRKQMDISINVTIYRRHRGRVEFKFVTLSESKIVQSLWGVGFQLKKFVPDSDVG